MRSPLGAEYHEVTFCRTTITKGGDLADNHLSPCTSIRLVYGKQL